MQKLAAPPCIWNQTVQLNYAQGNMHCERDLTDRQGLSNYVKLLKSDVNIHGLTIFCSMKAQDSQ